MPELPEVEVLLRHLKPLLTGRTIQSVHVLKPRLLRPDSAEGLVKALEGCTLHDVSRRAKYLLFSLTQTKKAVSKPFRVLGHLGMTGRMFVQEENAPVPKHTVLHWRMGAERFVFEDTRGFGRFTLDLSGLEALGLEPWDPEFTPDKLKTELHRSTQAIKVKLLDQSLVCGVGNIYASEALFRAGIDPRTPAGRLTPTQRTSLRDSIRSCLQEAIDFGSSLALDFAGRGSREGLFYYGTQEGSATAQSHERFHVYDREGQPCLRCKTPIQRITQAARSTFFCSRCQPKQRSKAD